MAGKPGVVVIEGEQQDVSEFYQRLKSLSWQKMTSKFKQIENLKHNDTNTIDYFRKFVGFEEKNFDQSGQRGNHPSLGELKKTLESVGLGHLFSDLIGLTK
eukprot:TRINITY_DN738_c0_g2_i1.p1 TRINITY_DN738_c0_g2~~TRINITY_DN738_c0_g2_i1.p1  ORF type:complete len:101 (-),score=19.13 TRINITY_DN738_c0_g2_i1:29-331(-)